MHSVAKKYGCRGRKDDYGDSRSKTVRFGDKVAEVSDCSKIEVFDGSGKHLKTTQTFI